MDVPVMTLRPTHGARLRRTSLVAIRTLSNVCEVAVHITAAVPSAPIAGCTRWESPAEERLPTFHSDFLPWALVAARTVMLASP